MKATMLVCLICLSSVIGWVIGHPLNYDIAKQSFVVWSEETLASNVSDPSLKNYADKKVREAKIKLLYLEGIKIGAIENPYLK